MMTYPLSLVYQFANQDTVCLYNYPKTQTPTTYFIPCEQYYISYPQGGSHMPLPILKYKIQNKKHINHVI